MPKKGYFGEFILEKLISASAYKIAKKCVYFKTCPKTEKVFKRGFKAHKERFKKENGLSS